MRNALTLLILVTFLVPYAAEQGWIPSAVKYLEELTAALIAAYVIFVGARTRFANVRAEYWLVFGALVIVIACGVVVNTEPAGPLFAGMRAYLRHLPLFFLPAVFMIDDRILRRQLVLILLISFLQAPVTIYQRVTMWSKGHISGDWAIGTLMNSGILSIFLICVACVITGMYLRRRISLPTLLIILLIVLAPTMVNETKATLFLVPIGILTTMIAGARPHQRVRNAVAALFVVSVFVSVFIPVYDYYVKPRWGYGLLDFMTMPGRLEGYLEKRRAGIGGEDAGRIDAIVVPLEDFARDPAKLAFGVGIGNASDSALGDEFYGEYYYRYAMFGQSTAARLILETGLLGLALVFLLLFMNFRDAKAVAARDETLHGALAAGWTGVTAVIACSMFYKEMIPYGTLGFFYFYFSGVIATRRVIMRRRARTEAPLPALQPGLVPARRTGAAV